MQSATFRLHSNQPDMLIQELRLGMTGERAKRKAASNLHVPYFDKDG